MIHTVKGFYIVNETEVDTCILYDPTNARNLISGSSTFFKPNLYI